MKKMYSIVGISMMAAVLLSVPMPVAAATKTTTVQTTVTTTETVTATPTASQTIDYALPYPGLLPDNPLYFLKQVRDWILDKLIMDPVKKSEFYILQADKRLSMGMLLDQSGKNSLGEETISKGEKYMSNAVQALLTMKSQGKDVPGYIVDHLTQALTKHAQVLMEEIAKAGAAEKAGLTTSLNLVAQLQGELAKLK